MRAPSTSVSTSRLARDERPLSPGAARDAREERRELEEEGEGDEDADRRDPAAVEDGVGEAREPERGGDGDEEEHRPALGEAAVDEPVRRVVATALGDGAPGPEPQGGDERRVEDRDREDEDGRARAVAIVVPASLYDAIRPSVASTNPISWLPESPMNTRAGPLEPEVVGDEADEGEREARGDDEDVAVRRDEGGRQREARRGDDAQAAGQPVHVVEQVEGVREPDEPQHPDRPAERRAGDELDRDGALEDDERGRELGAELGGGVEVDDVVEQAEREHDGAADHERPTSRRESRRGRSRSRRGRRARSRRRCRCRRKPASGSCASGRGADRPRTPAAPAASAAARR